jgi:hypothetical protein
MAEIPPPLASLPGLTDYEIELFHERAGVFEFDGGLTHEEADRLALKYVMEYRKKAPQSAIEGHSGAGEAPDIKTYGNAPEPAYTPHYAGLEALQHMTAHGIKLMGAYESGAGINRARIEGDYDAAFTNDLAEIKALMAGLGDTAGRAQGTKITLFRFIPGLYDFLCLDIDRGHSDGVDGLAELYRFFDSIGKTKENLPPVLRELPQSFPCYVTTPSGGFHLYFKYRGPKSWGLFANVRGVEIKHMKPGLTAPGSRKASGEYVLYGSLEAAPLLPAFIKNRLTLPKEERPPGYIGPGREKKKYGAASWEKIREWVDTDGSYAGRNARAFAFAVKARTHGWEKTDTLRALRMEPSVEGLPETEYISVVNSAYSKGSVKA